MVMGELVGVALRFWASFFRTLLALLLLPPLLLLLLLPPLAPGVEGNQERLMISVRLSFCLSSYADGEKEVQSRPLPERLPPVSPHPTPQAHWPPRTV